MIVVLGLGRETRELLAVLERDRPGCAVLLLDERPMTRDDVPEHPNLALAFTGDVDLDVAGSIPLEADAIYRSPGVSPYRPAIATAIARGIPVTTPTGLWASGRDNGDVVAITGTKGKSTTAALTAHLLTAAGRHVSLRGNIGHAALLFDDPGPRADDVVLELSSYQLADLEASFGIGAITTLLRDHVPWHGSLERYHADKLRLLAMANQTIVTPDVARFLVESGPGFDGHLDAVVTEPVREAVREALGRAGLIGEHLVQDAELALALTDARLEHPSGVTDLIGALASFVPLPHRLTPVGDHLGVRFVDDSISTVPESAVAAVRAYLPRGPVTVLLGGDERGQILEPLVELLHDPQVRAVLLPPLAQRLAAALKPVAGDRVELASDLADAIERAVAITPRGGSVLLSPAAPSFSTYRDFVARGEHFTALVGALEPAWPASSRGAS